MSYFPCRLPLDPNTFETKVPPPQTAGMVSPPDRPTDHDIDVSLRSVPLPDGLMTRLGVLAYSLPGGADRVDRRDCF
jgi:hypothetical protein